MDKPSTVTIVYRQKDLCNLPFTSITTFNDIRNDLAKKYQFITQLVNLMMNATDTVSDYQQKVKSHFGSQTVHNEITLNPIEAKVSFYQMDNEDNCFTSDYDLVNLSIPSFKESTFKFFKGKLEEFNYKITQSEFYNSDKEDSLFFQESDTTTGNNNKPFHSYFNNNELLNIKFYFLIKNDSVVFYKSLQSDTNTNANVKDNEIDNEVNAKTEKTNKIVLRQDVVNGQAFSVVIQTYNHLIKEIRVYPEMTIGELKEKIEEAFLVRREYQELLYLVYKLKDDSKTIKDYYIRPQGIIFLRGFFFPIIFVDFYEKSNKNIISINIAERISFVKGEVIAKLKLENNYDYKLLFNGKELNDECFLIDYNVQRMQMIYFK